MSNFKKRFIISLLAFPIIYILLYQKIFSNFLIFIVFIFCVYEWNKIFIKKNYIYLLGFLILLFFLVSLLKIYNAENYNLKFLWLVLIAWLTDVGGYIFGKLFGGPKLIKISPNKTYTGVFGSFFCSILFIYIFLFYIEIFYNLDFTFDLKFFSYIFFISFISQTGDLVVSYFKRLSNIKDTGKLIPGHGGILDRIDGMIFAFPVIFILDFYFK